MMTTDSIPCVFSHHAPDVWQVVLVLPVSYPISIENERTFSEQAHDTPRLPTISYWQQYIHEII